MQVDRKSTRLNSSHANISYAVFCLKKKISPGITRFASHRGFRICLDRTRTAARDLGCVSEPRRRAPRDQVRPLLLALFFFYTIARPPDLPPLPLPPPLPS